MRTLTTFTALLLCLNACAGTDPSVENNNDTGTNNGGTNNGANNGGDNNGGVNNGGVNNGGVNNGVVNNGANNGVVNNGVVNNGGMNNGATNNGGVNNGTPATWRALVANGDAFEDTSTWSIIEFDGTATTASRPVAFGSGKLAAAASGGRGYVVDLDTGMVVVIDAATGAEIATVDLGVGEIDSAASANGGLAAASGGTTRIAQYADASGGLGQEINIADLTFGDPLFVRAMAVDGNVLAGVSTTSSMFPTTPKVFIADTSSATLQGDIEIRGAERLDSMGNGSFAVATKSDGILILQNVGGTWNMDDKLMTAGSLGSEEIGGVVMANATKGIALTYSTTNKFRAQAFDATAGTAAVVGGLALPTSLIGGDASSDGKYYFIGDYGIRNPNPEPWGVAVIDQSGVLLDHFMTDEALPPMSIAALD